MKNIQMTGLFMAILLYTFSSCKKTAHQDDPTAESVNINIITPQPAQEYEPGDTVKMHISITSPAPLHGYELHLMRLSDSVEVFSIDEHLHEKSFDIHALWVNDGLHHSDMLLNVITEIDHDGHTAAKQVKFHCHAL